MNRLSIIVPMYKVAPYVKRCIISLLEQDVPKEDYEIICINDGSPDNCRRIIEDLQKEHCNIVLINQENQGVSRARNNGIDKANGKYLLFVDPDDYVDANCFTRILKTADEKQAQVSFLGFIFLNEEGNIRNVVLNDEYKDKVYLGIETYFIARGDGKTDPDRMVAVLFQSEFLKRNNLRYLPDVSYLEDGEFIVRILCLADRCIFDGYSFYQRTTRPGSATQSKLFNSEKATSGFLLAASNLKMFQREQNLTDKQREFINQPIVKFVLLAVNSSIGWRSFKKFSNTVKALKALTFNRIKLEGCNLEYRIYGKLYNLSPWLGALALVILPRINRIYIHNKIRKNLPRI